MKKLGIIVLFGIFLSIGLFLSIPKVKAIEREHSTTSEANKDTYVWSSEGYTNFDEENPLLFGEFHQTWHEIYVHFNLNDKPENWSKAELNFMVDWLILSQEVNVSLVLIQDPWNEALLTWNNRPSHSEIIKTFSVRENSQYIVDITKYITGEGISLCINASDNNQKGLGAISKIPQIKWTYNELAWINVTKPINSTKELMGGEQLDIEWTSVGSIENVALELYKGDIFFNTILKTTDNDGLYTWKIPEVNDLHGSNFSIRISDVEDNRVYNFSSSFSIEQKIVILKPSQSENLIGTENFTIRWNCIDSIKDVKIELCKEEESIKTIAENTQSDGYYEWIVPNGTHYNGTNFQIKISDISNSKNFMFSEEFTIHPKIDSETNNNSDEPGDRNNDGAGLLIFLPYMILALVVLIGISIALVLQRKDKFG